MKKTIIALIILSLILIQLNFVLAIADPNDNICENLPSGQLFGQHVSMHAKEGHFNGEMNPGMHKGYSICVLP